MKTVNWQYWVIIAISASTGLGALIALFASAFQLNLMGAPINPGTCQFFSTIGMFMACFSGVQLHSLLFTKNDEPSVMLWSSFEKMGGSTCVAIGAFHQIFAPWLYLLSAFGMLSGLLILWYWFSIRNN